MKHYFTNQIENPIRQHITGRGGLYRSLAVVENEMSASEFQQSTRGGPTDSEDEMVSQEFWRNLTSLSSPLYAADVAGSLCGNIDYNIVHHSDAMEEKYVDQWEENEMHSSWHIGNLDTLLTKTVKDAIPGVTTPYVYLGSWRSFFAWHTEDQDLYSINFLHFGARKTWYCIPPSQRDKFERSVKDALPDLFESCSEFLRHKEILCSPTWLQKHDIPYVTCSQREGEIIITMPGAFHAGFNHGFNCAESVNFGTKHWLPFGRVAKSCKCAKDSVSIDMKLFAGLFEKKEEGTKSFELSAEKVATGENSNNDASDDAVKSDYGTKKRKLIITQNACTGVLDQPEALKKRVLNLFLDEKEIIDSLV